MTQGLASELLRQRINRFGPISFSDFIDLALYDPEAGFYSTGGTAGRRGDFLTSPELGPLFGTVLASALDSWWDELEQPDPYVVVEAGAGSGSLAAAVLAAAPRCLRALRYVLVERSARQRETYASRLHLEPPAYVLGPAAQRAEDPDEPALEPSVVPGTGPVITSLAELPGGKYRGVVLANELLDNLAFDLVEFDGSGWNEVRVAYDEDAKEFVELLTPAVDELSEHASALLDSPSAGARIPLQRQARQWLVSALGCLEAGRVVLFDYADTTASMAARPWLEWVRTYRGHDRGGHPLAQPGDQDVTCEVAIDQLVSLQALDVDRRQSAFLKSHGIDEVVTHAAAAWRERAHVGDLEAVRAKSRVSEADALVDESGLGGFRAMEWLVR